MEYFVLFLEDGMLPLKLMPIRFVAIPISSKLFKINMILLAYFIKLFRFYEKFKMLLKSFEVEITYIFLAILMLIFIDNVFVFMMISIALLPLIISFVIIGMP